MANTILSTGEVSKRLCERYSKTGTIFLTELGDTAGFGARRRCDAFVYNIFSNEYGYGGQGFEIKVSRTDLDKELQDPSKWEEIGQYCNRWWLVVGDKKILDGNLDRLPTQWGIMYPTPTRLKVYRPASELNPVPYTPDFVAAIFCRYMKQQERIYQKSDEKKRMRAEYDRGYEIGKQYNGDSSELERLKSSLTSFEKASGVKISTWDGDRTGRNFKEFQEDKSKYSDILRSAKNIKRDVGFLNECIGGILGECES